LHNAKKERIRSATLAKKRSRNPELRAFGQRLTELRGAKRSRQQICNRLSDLKVPLDASSLFQYEAGTVWAPDAGVLWGLSEIYEVPLAELVALLRANRARPDAGRSEWRDLIRHETKVQRTLPPNPGESDVPDQARIRELEDRLEEYERVMHAVIEQLVETTAAGAAGQGRAPAPGSAKSGRGGRKAG
jgi:transcriptional regulator with XRE-family HTH domain